MKRRLPINITIAIDRAMYTIRTGKPCPTGLLGIKSKTYVDLRNDESVQLTIEDLQRAVEFSRGAYSIPYVKT